MTPPVILLGSWRRTFATMLDPRTELETINPSYVRAVRRAGGVPLIAPHPSPDELAAILPLVDGVVLTGGQDVDPTLYGAEPDGSRGTIRHSDEADIALFNAAVEAGLPILAICRGIQVANVALGGSLLQEIQAEGQSHHPTYAEMTEPLAHRHPIELEPQSRIARIYGATSIVVNSLHHQSVAIPAEGLRTVATSPDGLVEAIEGESCDLVAVQWHPELLDPADGDPLFDDLVERAVASRSLRVGAVPASG